MVNSMSLLEPPDADDDVEYVDVVMPVDTDSDDDNENGPYDGYEPLPMEPSDEPMNNLLSEDDENDDPAIVETSSSTNDHGIPEIVPIEVSLVKEVWSQPSSSTEIEMDADKINEVKRVMSNFTLPLGNIPDWANAIPEEQWKDKLLDKLENIKQK